MRKDNLLKDYILLVMAALLYGFQLFGISIMEKNGYSLLETIIVTNVAVFLTFAWGLRKTYKSFFKFPIWVIILYPIICIVMQVAMYGPLYLGVSLSLTLFILYTYPIWTTIISVMFLNVKITKTDIISSIVIIAGILILLAPWQGISYSILGLILALIGGLLIAGWLMITAHFSKNDVKPTTIAGMSCLYISVAFILTLPLAQKFISDPTIVSFTFNRSFIIYSMVITFSIVALALPSILFYKASTRINNIHLGLTLLLELVVGTTLDIIFLDTMLTWNIIVGGALILLANAAMIVFDVEKDG